MKNIRNFSVLRIIFIIFFVLVAMNNTKTVLAAGQLIIGHSPIPDREAAAKVKVLTITYPQESSSRLYSFDMINWYDYYKPITITQDCYVHTKAVLSDGTVVNGGIRFDNTSGADKPILKPVIGDVDGDSRVTSTDSALIQRKLLGKISSFPIEALVISSVDNINVNVLKGDGYSLPAVIVANMLDGSIRQVPVMWDQFTIDTSITGTYTTSGVVEGYDGKVILTVNVVEAAPNDNSLIDASIPDSHASLAKDIIYTTNIKSNDLKIYSYKKYEVENRVEFFIDYESGIDRNISFFDPPSGDVFMKYAYGLKAGRYLLKFSIPLADYTRIDEVTLKFWTGGNGGPVYADWVYFNTASQNIDTLSVVYPTEDDNTYYFKGVNIGFNLDIQVPDEWSGIKLYNAEGTEIPIDNVHTTSSAKELQIYSEAITDGTYTVIIPAGTIVDASGTKYNSDINIVFNVILENNSGNPFIDDSIPDSDINNAVDVNYVSDITSSDLMIYSFKKFEVGDKVEFFIDYESGIDRNISFFNPPSGDVFMKHVYGLKAGRYQFKFSIPAGDYAKVSSITMKFWRIGDASNPDWIFIDKNAEGQAPIGTLTPNEVSPPDINTGNELPAVRKNEHVNSALPTGEADAYFKKSSVKLPGVIIEYNS